MQVPFQMQMRVCVLRVVRVCISQQPDNPRVCSAIPERSPSAGTNTHSLCCICIRRPNALCLSVFVIYNSETVCKPCTLAPLATVMCFDCSPLPTLQGFTGQSSCTDSCAPAGSAACCARYQNCTSCRSGQYSAWSGGAGSCVSCAPGTYQPNLHKSSCMACPDGKSVSYGGAAVCFDCVPGKYSITPGSPKVECDSCPAGTYAPLPGLSVCPPCPPGNFSMGGQSACSQCLPGTYTSSFNTSESCIGCPPGSFMSGSGATICTPCAAGSFSPDTGAKNCTLCPLGYDVLSALSCVCDSSLLMFAPLGLLSVVMCIRTFSGSPNSANCTLCQPGRYAAFPGAAVCTLCPATFYSATAGATACLACERVMFRAYSHVAISSWSKP